MAMPFILILCSTLLGFCLSAVLAAAVVKNHNLQKDKDRETIKALQRKITKALQEENTAMATSFAASLNNASLATGLEATRLQAGEKVHKHPPEKYLILKRLASQGMETEEIADIVGISAVEAGQLVRLSRMADCPR